MSRMFNVRRVLGGLFGGSASSQKPKAATARPSFRPQLEGLGERIAPSSISDLNPSPTGGEVVELKSESTTGSAGLSGGKFGPQLLLLNRPPVIQNFSVAAVGNGMYTFSGNVVDESPAGLTITFGGSVATTFGMTVTTASDGSFSLSVTLLTNGDDTGTVTVHTFDNKGLGSNTPSVYVSPA